MLLGPLLIGIGAIVSSSPSVRAGEQPAGLEMAREIQTAIRAVAHDHAPAIVAIRARRQAPATDASGTVQPDARVAVNGAGVVVRADGLILTSEHVIQNATEIFVTLNSGQRYRAEVTAADHRGDLAVLKIAADNLPTIAFCDWSRTSQGDWVVAVGNPLGIGGDGQPSVAVGNIASFNRKLPGLGIDDDRLYTDLIQFTAAIHPGHSGGPLLNLNGELVGIVTAMHIRAAEDAPLSFALPLTSQRIETIRRLCRGESIEYGYLGVVVSESSDTGGGKAAAAVVISVLDAQGPAMRAGLCVGDRILSCDGKSVTSPSQFASLVGQTPVGMSLQIEVNHEGIRRLLTIAVERRQLPRVAQMRATDAAIAGMPMP